MAWPQVLKAGNRVASSPERALFPTSFGADENCVSYERYRADFKTALLAVVPEPSVRRVPGPHLMCAPEDGTEDLALTPHTVRAIYATHRMDLCDGPGAFRQLMEDLGWLTPSTVLQYDRPQRVDPRLVQDRLMTAFGKERS